MSTIATSEAPSYMVQRSTWHSPVPYLFGGLAAMLGLIAFALLILACSYWKLSGQINDAERDLEAGEKDGSEKVARPVLVEKFAVIMAGEVNPTFLATPMTSRASSFGSNTSCGCGTNGRGSGTSTEEESEKKETGNGQVEMSNLEAQVHQDLESQVH